MKESNFKSAAAALNPVARMIRWDNGGFQSLS